MRQLLLILLGIAIGGLATANIVNALRQRDAYPRGLMNVMQHHFAALRKQAHEQHCDQDVKVHLTAMRLMSDQIEDAIYAGHQPDPEFHTDAQRLRDALDAADNKATSSNPCAALIPVLGRVGDACDTCHRSYR